MNESKNMNEGEIYVCKKPFEKVADPTEKGIAGAIKEVKVNMFGKDFKVVCDESVSIVVRKNLKKFFDPINHIYSNCINALKPGEFYAFEIKREKELFSENTGRLSSTGMGNSLNDIFPNFLGNKDLTPGEIVTVIIVRKDKDNSLHISEEKIDCFTEGLFNIY